MFVLIISFVAGCVTGEKVANISPGMTKSQVFEIMGKSDGFRKIGEYETYKYVNRLISGWSWDRADYTFIFKNDQLVEYGPGQVRERNVGGLHTVFIYQL